MSIDFALPTPLVAVADEPLVELSNENAPAQSVPETPSRSLRSSPSPKIVLPNSPTQTPPRSLSLPRAVGSRSRKFVSPMADATAADISHVARDLDGFMAPLTPSEYRRMRQASADYAALPSPTSANTRCQNLLHHSQGDSRRSSKILYSPFKGTSIVMTNNAEDKSSSSLSSSSLGSSAFSYAMSSSSAAVAAADGAVVPSACSTIIPSLTGDGYGEHDVDMVTMTPSSSSSSPSSIAGDHIDHAQDDRRTHNQAMQEQHQSHQQQHHHQHHHHRRQHSGVSHQDHPSFHLYDPPSPLSAGSSSSMLSNSHTVHQYASSHLGAASTCYFFSPSLDTSSPLASPAATSRPVSSSSSSSSASSSSASSSSPAAAAAAAAASSATNASSSSSSSVKVTDGQLGHHYYHGNSNKIATTPTLVTASSNMQRDSSSTFHKTTRPAFLNNAAALADADADADAVLDEPAEASALDHSNHATGGARLSTAASAASSSHTRPSSSPNPKL